MEVKSRMKLIPIDVVCSYAVENDKDPLVYAALVSSIWSSHALAGKSV